MSYETESWPYTPAKFIGPKRSKPVRGVVIHTAEAVETTRTAENVAKYFQNPDYPSSAHITVDNDTIIQCVKDSYIADAAPGTNEDFIQVELAGYMSQTAAQWRDLYSLAMLAIAADAVAQYCLKYNLPAVHLTNEDLLAGHRGIIGHYQASQVYKKSDHMDPGPGFPWPRFIAMVAMSKMERR